MQLISYGGRPVAVVVHGDLAVFDPRLEAAGVEDPLWRFTAAMCRLAMEIELGIAAGRYDDERAERFARELLMSADDFVQLATLPDTYLAAWFGVPIDQVQARRDDLGLHALTGGSDGPPGLGGRMTGGCP